MKSFSAILVFSLFVIGCKPKPEDYVGKAIVHVNEKNFALAIEEYKKLINDHPNSPQAEEAMFMVASLYHNELRDFRTAVNMYQQFAGKYPMSQKAPTALFLVGFLCNDELKDLEGAKKAYEKFLATYPEHEMAKSATFELQNLGKRPEELLPALQESPAEVAAQKPTVKSGKKR